MSKEIYNEGRVVGFSSYETYLRQFLAENPSGSQQPASERAWLASSLGGGASLLLKLSNLTVGSTGYGVIEIPLPQNCNLCAASTISASFFEGTANFGNALPDVKNITEEQVTVGEAYLANTIISYGQLLDNTENSIDTESAKNKIDNDSAPCATPLSGLDTATREQLRGYIHLVDGLVLQPGEWRSTADPENEVNQETVPAYDLHSPNFTRNSVVRIKFDSNINETMILLTGFLPSTVVTGESGFSGSVGTEFPQDGDFLGPQQFPWAAKIIFNVPTSYIEYFLGSESGNYSRKLPKGGADPAEAVTSTPIIDMQHTDPSGYYDAHHRQYGNARILMNVEGLAGDQDNAVLAVYQKSPNDPPALYGARVSEIGDVYLNPIDVVAPGKVKLFPADTSAEDIETWQNNNPGTVGIVTDSNGVIKLVGTDTSGHTLLRGTAIGVKRDNINYTTSAAEKAGLVELEVNGTRVLCPVVSSAQGEQYTISVDAANPVTSGNTSYNRGSLPKIVPTGNNVTWVNLLDALANNKSIDILGNRLKALKAGLDRADDTTGDATPYIQFPAYHDHAGPRLYICREEPTDSDIPVGSIGIGW